MNLFLLFSALIIQGYHPPADPPRSIMLFGNKAEPLVEQQWQLLKKDSIGVADRDIKIIIAEPGNVLYKTYAIPVQDPFTILLIGRDGGEKYRSNLLTSTSHLFALIDAMPMRRAEVNRKKNDQR